MENTTLVYDLETLRIPYTGGKRIPGVEYAEGWKDYKGLGVSVLCAYSSIEDSISTFFIETLPDFVSLANKHDRIVGHNSSRFDDRILKALGYEINTTHDTLLLSREAAGLDPNFNFPPRRQKILEKYSGFSLEVLSIANFGKGKLSKGELAPLNWQRGNYDEVIEYCQDDVLKTHALFELGVNGELWCPTFRKFLKFRMD